MACIAHHTGKALGLMLLASNFVRSTNMMQKQPEFGQNSLLNGQLLHTLHLCFHTKPKSDPLQDTKAPRTLRCTTLHSKL